MPKRRPNPYHRSHHYGPDNDVFVHTQQTPATEWVVNHNLDKYPSVTVVNTNGEEIEGQVVYVSRNQVRVRFNSLESGKAFCS